MERNRVIVMLGIELHQFPDPRVGQRGGTELPIEEPLHIADLGWSEIPLPNSRTPPHLRKNGLPTG